MKPEILNLKCFVICTTRAGYQTIKYLHYPHLFNVSICQEVMNQTSESIAIYTIDILNFDTSRNTVISLNAWTTFPSQEKKEERLN